MKRHYSYGQVFATVAAGVTMVFVLLGTASAHKASTTLSMGFFVGGVAANPVDDGDNAEIRANFTATTSSEDQAAGGIFGVTLTIKRLENLSGDPQPCSELGNVDIDWATFAEGLSDASGNFSVFLDTTGLGGPPPDGNKQCFRVHEVPAGGGAHGYLASAGPTPAQDLIIIQACTGPSIAVSLVGGDGTPAPGQGDTWLVGITVTACDALTGVTAQGGVGTGKVAKKNPSSTTITYTSDDQGTTPGSGNTRKWTIGDLGAGESKTVVVTLKGNVGSTVAACSEINIVGPWSAKGTNASSVLEQTAHALEVLLEVAPCP